MNSLNSIIWLNKNLLGRKLRIIRKGKNELITHYYFISAQLGAGYYKIVINLMSHHRGYFYQHQEQSIMEYFENYYSIHLIFILSDEINQNIIQATFIVIFEN